MKMINNISAMTLGTVQLGMNYDIANDGGKPDETKSFSILASAPAFRVLRRGTGTFISEAKCYKETYI